MVRALQGEGFFVVLISRWHLSLRLNWRLWRLADRLSLVRGAFFSDGTPTDFPCRPYGRAIRSAIRKYDPVGVIVEYLWLAPCLDEVPPRIVTAIDTHDVMHLRRQVFRDHPVGVWVDCTRAEEANMLARADVVIAIQERERGIFGEMLPETRVICVPHTCLPDVAATSDRQDREVVTFVGSRTQGNLVGLLDFLRLAWPRIRAAHPTVRLDICGDIADRVDGDFPGVRKVGFVENLDEVYRRSTVIVNPVTLGTGLKIKSVEALAYGRALVTTSCGADGITEGQGDAFLIEDDMESFGDAVIRVLQDAHLRRSLEGRARSLAEKSFGPRAAIRELTDILAPEAFE